MKNKVFMTAITASLALLISGCNGMEASPFDNAAQEKNDNLRKAVVILIEKVQKLESNSTNQSTVSKIQPPSASSDEILTLKQKISNQEAQIKLQQQEMQSIKSNMSSISQNTNQRPNENVNIPSSFDVVIKDFANGNKK